MISLDIVPDWHDKLDEDFMAIMRPLDKEHTYNARIVEALLPILKPTTPEQGDRISKYVYIARQQIGDEKAVVYADKMIADGWTMLTEAIVRQAHKAGKRLHVSASVSMDWLTQPIDQVYKPFVHPVSGNVMIMKPRARSRGYKIQQFDNAYCKLV